MNTQKNGAEEPATTDFLFLTPQKIQRKKNKTSVKKSVKKIFSFFLIGDKVKLTKKHCSDSKKTAILQFCNKKPPQCNSKNWRNYEPYRRSKKNAGT